MNGFSTQLFARTLVVGSLAVGLPSPVAGLQNKIPRVGYLSASSESEAVVRTKAFRAGLRELGYVEGDNLILEIRYADGQFHRLPALARDLIEAKVDVIVTAGPSVTGPAKQATATIPIVMTNDSDPVGSGFAASLARPGGNITGLSSLAQELSGKRVEILAEIVPKLLRVAIFGSSSIPGNARATKETEKAAGALGIKTQYFDIADAGTVNSAFGAAKQWRAEAGVVLNGPPHIQMLMPAAATKHRLPAIYSLLAITGDEGLLSYGVSISDLDRRAAIYVDKILKGANPAVLPIERPTKFEFIVNLKAAKQIGLTIPPHVLARADRVIR